MADTAVCASRVVHSALDIIQEETASPDSNLDLEDDIFVIVTRTRKKMRLINKNNSNLTTLCYKQAVKVFK